MNDKPQQSVDYRAKLRRFNLLAALAKRGITAAERAEMDALAAELEAAELARAGAPVDGGL